MGAGFRKRVCPRGCLRAGRVQGAQGLAAQRSGGQIPPSSLGELAWAIPMRCLCASPWARHFGGLWGPFGPLCGPVRVPSFVSRPLSGPLGLLWDPSDPSGAPWVPFGALFVCRFRVPPLWGPLGPLGAAFFWPRGRRRQRATHVSSPLAGTAQASARGARPLSP